MSGRLFVVGLGPGDRSALTGQALAALRRAEVVIGYSGYFPPVADLLQGKECLALPLTQEVERARLAVEQLRRDRTVCVISSGDPGIYGMASLVLECLAAEEELLSQVEIVPGVSAVHAAAALLGAPLGHDFAVVSLSDLLTPWHAIERRLEAAASADFVLALLNPQSRRRDWQYRRAAEVLARHRPSEAPVGIVRNAYRPGQSVEITTVARMAEAPVDMFTTVIVGSTQTRRVGPVVFTPRGYPVGQAASLVPGCRTSEAACPTGDILADSFRIIDAEVGPHSFAPDEWQVVRRMIHAAGDLDLVRSACFTPGAVAAGVQALRRRAPLVTDVRMVAAGIHRPSLEALGVALHCFIDDPDVARLAETQGGTRSRRAMEKAIALVGEGVYVVGNAPTALLALGDAVRSGVVRPRLIVAMPVGFVSVAQSKEQALALGVPVLSVRGRKGGSAVAAAAVNALLHLARAEGQP
jgi:precorrin-3B C17-methyltransferase